MSICRFTGELYFYYSEYTISYKYIVKIYLKTLYEKEKEDIENIIKGQVHKDSSRYLLITDRKSLNIKHINKEISELYEKFDNLKTYLKTNFII